MSSWMMKPRNENVIFLFSVFNLYTNMRFIYTRRIILSMIAGVVAGVLGLTGFMGFVFYLSVMMLVSLGFAAKANFCVPKYFDKWHRIVFDGCLDAVMPFALFWTLAYDVVHLFTGAFNHA